MLKAALSSWGQGLEECRSVWRTHGGWKVLAEEPVFAKTQGLTIFAMEMREQIAVCGVYCREKKGCPSEVQMLTNTGNRGSSAGLFHSQRPVQWRLPSLEFDAQHTLASL